MKNSNELEFILNIIQSRTGQNLETIANNIKLSARHLTMQKNNPEYGDVEKTLFKVKDKYADVLKEENRILDEDKLNYLQAAVEVVLPEIARFRSLENQTFPAEELLRLNESIRRILKMRQTL